MGTYPIAINYRAYWKEKPQFVKLRANEPFWLMFAVEDGRFAYTIDNVGGEAARGDVVMCPPCTEFQREVLAPLSFHYFIFHLRETDDPAAESKIADMLRLLFSFKYTASEQDRLFQNYRQLNRLDRIPDATGKQRIEHFVNDIWLLFHMDAEHNAKQGLLDEDRLMKEAKAIIERHAFREVRLQDIAALLHIHPVQLSRRFQHVFGLPPSRYLISIRMERAKSLLVETEYTLDHIARLCGYENGFYFSRVFTHYTGTNPSLYRKKHSEASP